MPTVYALNMWFDPTSNDGLFEPYKGSDNSGRGWFTSTDGGAHWQFAGNPDTFAPVLSAAGGDSVQFAVNPTSTPTSPISSVALTVLFATDRAAANNPARIASPFQLPDGNTRCVLSDPAGTWNTWHLIGPYGLAVNTNRSGRGRLRFEFAVAARVTLADGTVRDYGYDPEMDVDV
jgi:hypothetical protein